MIRRLNKKSKCEFEGCRQPATEIAKGRDEHSKIGLYCDVHAAIVEDEGNPEYTECCPNCGCRFGVN